MKKIKDFIGWLNLKSVLKRFFFLLGCFLFLEIIFALSIFDSYEKEGIINIILYSVIISSLFSVISGLFKSKINRIITIVILGIEGLLFSVQLVFYNVFKTFFSFNMMGLGDQLESFLKETITAIFNNFLYIILFFLPLVFYIIKGKKMKLVRNGLKNYLLYMALFCFSIGIFFIHMNMTKGIDNGTYMLVHDVNYTALNISKLGVNNAYFLDIFRSVFGFNEKLIIKNDKKQEDKKEEIKDTIIKYDKNILSDITFDKETNNSEIKTINTYMENELGTDQNSYTGLFKNYNLVYIVAESFSEIGVSEELTPTLYKLTHQGFIFDKYYTPNTLSTIGGEFQALTGIYPDSSILNKWRKGSNYFPYGLATTFQNLDYNTFAYHNNWYGFQDRHKYLKSQGFNNYIGCKNGMEKRMNCNMWPQSDLEMIKGTINDYVNSDKPFLAYYMTVSGHFQYNFSDNSMAYKNRKLVNDLKVSTSAKAYVATQIELDRALEYLINELDKNNKLDNTVIVLLADHYPYKLSLSDINSLSTYTRDSVVEVNHNALILWNNNIKDIHIDKPCMSSDVIPTIYNLFGIAYDSRLFTGRDILSTDEGLVVFNNRSWITSKGTYFASNSKFVSNETVDEDYVSNINNLVKNRLMIGRLIIKNDYYNYLLK